MPPEPTKKTPLEAALDTFTLALAAWDPLEGDDLEDMLQGLRELQLRFDPRRDRISAAMCVTCMKLLEALRTHGAVQANEVISAVNELAGGLRRSLRETSPTQTPTTLSSARQTTLTLAAPSPGGLSLARNPVETQELGELMVYLKMLTPEQVKAVRTAQAAQFEPRPRFGQMAVQLGFVTEGMVDMAVRMQSRAREQDSAPPLPDGDPWGDRPL